MTDTTIDRLQERLQAVGDVLFEWQAALDYASANRIDPDPLLTRHVEQIRTALCGDTGKPPEGVHAMTTPTRRPDKVEPGQVWRDNDPRSVGTGEFVVQAVIPGEQLDGPRFKPHRSYALVQRRDAKQSSWIAVDRLLSEGSQKRGYTYLGRER